MREILLSVNLVKMTDSIIKMEKPSAANDVNHRALSSHNGMTVMGRLAEIGVPRQGVYPGNGLLVDVAIYPYVPVQSTSTKKYLA